MEFECQKGDCFDWRGYAEYVYQLTATKNRNGV